MNAGLSRIGSTGLADFGGIVSGWPAALSYFSNKLVWLPVVLIGALGAWMVFSGHTAENQPSSKAGFIAAAPVQPTQ